MGLFQKLAEWNWSQSEQGKTEFSKTDDLKAAPSKKPQQSQQNTQRIAYLLNKRINLEILSKTEWKNKCEAIEHLMNCYQRLPYQICNCYYIGENRAYTLYNWNNKRTLELAINLINYHLSTVSSLDISGNSVPTDYNILFNSICFDYAESAQPGDLPRSYIVYSPLTKSGKSSTIPLIAYFNTLAGYSGNMTEYYMGEIHYFANGEIEKINLFCKKRNVGANFLLKYIGGVFSICSIEMIGKDGKPFVAYDFIDELSGYINYR